MRVSWLQLGVASLTVALAILVTLTVMGCEGDTASSPTDGDTTPPASVVDLTAGSPTDSSLVLTWTAPGDDGDTGTASTYDLRYAEAQVSEATWGSAIAVKGEPVPKPAGETESFEVTGLRAGTTYYFALKSRDEVANQWSALSNVTSATTSSDEHPDGMILVHAGTFIMGSPSDEPGYSQDEMQHTVTLTRSYYLAEHEVTQSEWQAVMGWNDSEFKGDPRRPVERVTWYDAIEFCNRKSQAEGLPAAYSVSGKTMSGVHIVQAMVTWNQNSTGFRLPTEAEWEYGCRAGTVTAFANGEITDVACSPVDPSLDLMGWYCGNAGDVTHPVGEKMANPWGLKDMHGNISEWCWDWYDSYDSQPVSNPKGPDSGYFRINRGGSWPLLAQDCRSAYRTYADPSYFIFSGVGFRVCRTAP